MISKLYQESEPIALKLDKDYKSVKNHKTTNNSPSDYLNSLNKKNLAGFIRIKLLAFLEFLKRENHLSKYNITNII
ncbi:MAG: hypothetical protein ACKKMW_03345 [Candidatus Nealsonbacteria bacterium]